MKHIQKAAEPIELTEFRNRWVATGTMPTWRDLEGEAPLVEALRRHLFAEQGYVCCYCSRRLIANDNHIEHLVPRDDTYGDSSLTFVWSNLLASCQANLMKGDPRHCGIAKGNWYDSRFMVSPLEPTCEKRFHFELDGRIRPLRDDDPGAAETIRHLNLDGPHLRGLRKKAIEALFDGLEHELQPEEFDTLITNLVERDREGKYESFCVTLVAALSYFRRSHAMVAVQ